MDLDALDPLIRSRRTSMLVDATRPVPHALVTQLCELATWAPNHKRTWPWRFTLVEGASRAALGAAIADAMHDQGDPPEKVAKARGKYLRTPATLVVGTAEGDTPLRSAENRDSVAAGVQNLMLAATAAGLATYWGSCPKGANNAVTHLCGWDASTHVTGLVYLGWATTEVAAPERPAPLLSFLT